MLRLSFLIVVIVTASCRKNIDPQSTDTLLESNVELKAIDILNNDTLLVAGGSKYEYGTVFTSYDGGQNWNRLDSITGTALYGCKWIDAQRAVAAGYGGQIVTSSDGGVTWTFHQADASLHIHAVEARNNSVWFAGGYNLSHGFTASGTNALQNIHADTFANEMRALLFVDSSNLYCAGYGLILRSSDLGNTWQPTPAEGDFFIGLADVNGKIYAAGLNGTVIGSDNNGASWNHVKRGNSPAKLGTIWNAFDGNENGLVIAGENGKMNWYDLLDGKWYRIDLNTDDDISAIKMLDNVVLCCTRQGRLLRVVLP